MTEFEKMLDEQYENEVTSIQLYYLFKKGKNKIKKCNNLVLDLKQGDIFCLLNENNNAEIINGLNYMILNNVSVKQCLKIKQQLLR